MPYNISERRGTMKTTDKSKKGMSYLTERALYYYFLMQEICEVGLDFWKFIATFFGVKQREIRAYERVLSHPVMAELSTLGDVEMYKNYLFGFACADNEFGKSKIEFDAIEVKALALHKSISLFGDGYVKSGRLRTLSHVYERDHFAAVLYAMQVVYLNSGNGRESLAESILLRELKDFGNSDAGIILLKFKKENAKEIMTYLSGTPDMLLRPEVLKGLAAVYGGKDGDVGYKGNRKIGF